MHTLLKAQSHFLPIVMAAGRRYGYSVSCNADLRHLLPTSPTLFNYGLEGMAVPNDYIATETTARDEIGAHTDKSMRSNEGNNRSARELNHEPTPEHGRTYEERYLDEYRNHQ